jgi:dethiobiotin synthetase
MSKGLFITGTDTGVGKTTVALSLMRTLQDKGLRVAGMKPVASGCEQTPYGLRNDDALKLLTQSSVQLPYEWINPYAFEPPIAPHIAAEKIGVTIDLNVIRACYEKIAHQVDVVIVEGAGGWLVPINDTQTMADIAVSLRLPVINVVAIRLGCLNHALLTHAAIVDSGATLTGWVANVMDPEAPAVEENIAALRQRTHADFLGATTVQDIESLLAKM